MDDDLENIYKQVKRKFKNLSEAEEEIEDEVEVDVEEPTSEPKGGIDVSQNADADLTGIEKQVQDNLEAAMEAAKQLNDEKLQQQIGNSLTFFTRQHVVKENLNESMYSKKSVNVKKNFKIKVYEHTRIKRTIRCFV
jgi:hypothetical protein